MSALTPKRKKTKMEKNNPIPCSPSDLTISGLVLGIQNDSITYVSKKTGKEETMKRDVLVLKSDFGIVICRFFNPSIDVHSLVKEGSSVTLPVNEYRIENGVKTATVRC